MHAGLQPSHPNRGRQSFSRYIGYHKAHAAIVIREKIIVIAAYCPAGNVQARQLVSEVMRSFGRQQASLYLAGLRQFHFDQLVRLFNRRETRVLNAYCRDVCHNRQKIEVLL